MKRLRLIGWLLFAVLLAACRPAPGERQGMASPRPELEAIDSQMWRQPDSAFAMLLEFADSPKADSLDTFNEHYFQLLVSELLYKNDYGQSNREELMKAVCYFDSLVMADGRCESEYDRNAFLDARAHYINGVGCYEADSVVEACGEYLKALEVMEDHFDEKELLGHKAQFMALIYTRLCVLFSDQYLHEQAIDLGKRALHYHYLVDAEPGHVSWTLNTIASHYEMMEQLDSAECYYRRALAHLGDTNTLMHRDVSSHLAHLSYKCDKDARSAVKKLHELLVKAETETECCARCAIIGEIFLQEGLPDSAYLYLSKVYRSNCSEALKKQAAEWLVDISRSWGCETESLEYADYTVPFANVHENQSAQRTRMTNLYHDSNQRRQEAVQRNKRPGPMSWASLALASMAIAVLLMAIAHSTNKKRQQQEILRLEQEFDREEAQHSAALAKARNKIVRLREENRELNERLSPKPQMLEEAEKRKENFETLTREGIYRNIVQRLKMAESCSSFDVKDYAPLALTQKEMNELFSAIDRHCPDFSKRLKKMYPELNRGDLQLCRLYLIGLSILQAAILLGTDYSSVRKRTVRLKKKLGSEEIHRCLRSFFFEG